MNSRLYKCTDALSWTVQVHYHIIPAPTREATSKISVLPVVPTASHGHVPTHEEMVQKEFEARQELQDDDAKSLQELIAAKL